MQPTFGEPGKVDMAVRGAFADLDPLGEGTSHQMHMSIHDERGSVQVLLRPACRRGQPAGGRGTRCGWSHSTARPGRFAAMTPARR